MYQVSFSVPLPKLDPPLFEKIAVRVIKPCCVEGNPQAIGSTVRVERHVAVGLQSLGKAELL
mgnify:CR=1 FL=1